MPKQANLRHEVAVIIPCYNAAPYLARALDSVFAQTYRDYCVYVVDDGSSDDTAAVLGSYAGRIVSLEQEHSGPAAARNHGIRQSNSPYVAFLDADDEWRPEKLERQVGKLREAPSAGMIYSDCFNNGDRSPGSYFARIGTPAGGRVFEQFLKNSSVFPSTVIVRRECLLDVGLFDETVPVGGEDYNLWLRIAASWEVEVIPEVLAIRHVTPGSLTRTTGGEQVASNLVAVFEKVLEACPNLTPRERRALEVAIGWRYYGYGSYLLAHGESRRSRPQFLKSWRYGVRNWRTIAGLGLGFLPHHTSVGLQNMIYKTLKSSRAQLPR